MLTRMRTYRTRDARCYAPGAPEKTPETVKPDGFLSTPDFDAHKPAIYGRMYEKNVPLARKEHMTLPYNPNIKYSAPFCSGWVLTIPKNNEHNALSIWNREATAGITELLIFDVDEKHTLIECITPGGSIIELPSNPKGKLLREIVHPRHKHKKKRDRRNEILPN